LLGTILLVLGGIAGFFVSLARRSAALSRACGAGILPASQEAAARASASVSQHTAPDFSPVCRSLTRHPTLAPRRLTPSRPRA